MGLYPDFNPSATLVSPHQSESSIERAHLHPHRRAHHYHHHVVGAKGQVGEGRTEPVGSRLCRSLLLSL